MGTIADAFRILGVICLFPLALFAQEPDCSGALTVCNSSPISFTSSGAGTDDFASALNDDGCLIGEHQSAWFFFELNGLTPPNSILEFTITPTGGFGQDYDFAVFGPGATCNNLGSPIRCSWADLSCGFCPATGLGNGESDFSEGASGNGFVAPLTVQAGQKYFLVVDNFSSNGLGFTLTWSGSAAPFLDCTATPGCSLEVSIAQPSLTVCQGASGALSLGAGFTGSGSPVFTWTATNGGLAYLNNPNILNPFVNLPANFTGNITYTLTAVDGTCTDNASVTVVVNPAPVPNITGDNNLCPGESAVLSAGSGYSSYTWSTGATSPSITVGGPGVYSVTVKDAQNCQGTASISVLQLQAPTPVITGPTEICALGSGILTATAGYDSYQWSTGSTSNTTVISQAGIYQVTVTENGCQGVAMHTVVLSSSLSPEISGDLDFCQGGSTLLDAGGGYVSYSWSNLTSGQSTLVTSPGLYTVTVQDASGCTGTASVLVSSNPLPAPNITTTLPEICPGNTATLSVTGGFNQISWSTGATGPSAIIHQPGNYSATVTDNNGCQGQANITIGTAVPPQPVISGVQSICHGEIIFLSVAGNYAFYQWSTGSNQASTQVNSPGQVGVTVTDSKGCTGSVSVNIPPASSPQPAIQGELEICPGGTTTLNAGAGFSNYEWSNGFSSPSITVNNPGVYSVTVTNSAGCSGTASATVSNYLVEPPDIAGPQGICDGQSAQLNAGSGFVSYQWSNNLSGQQITISQPGNYTVTVTDMNGCSTQASKTIAQFETPQPVIQGQSSICEGSPPVVLDAGAGYVSYLWSTFSNGRFLQVSEPGVYSVTVTSQQGCQGVASASVDEFPSPAPYINGPASFCEGQSITLMAEPGYQTYLWSNGSNTPNQTISQGGAYTLVVTDANGCQGETTVNITEFSSPNPGITGDLSICSANGSGLLVATDGFDSYEWSNSSSGNPVNIFEPGSYSVTVTDQNGCAGEASVLVAPLFIPNPVITGDLSICPGETTQLLVSGGNFTAYQWSNGLTQNSISVDQPGEYAVTVTGANGCTAENSVGVFSLPAPDPFIAGPESICSGELALLDAGSGFDHYLWSTGSTGSSINADEPGSYTVVVTNALGCTGIAEHSLSVHPQPSLNITGSLSFCAGGATTLSGSGGFQTYQWSNGLNTQSIQVSNPGVYTLVATDGNGCEVSKTVQIQVLTQLNPVISGDLSLCPDEQTILDAGAGYASYSWSNGSTASSIGVDSAGAFSVSVTDIYGCSGQTTVSVVQHAAPEVQILGDPAICQGQNSLLGLSGAALSAWTWSDNSTDSTLAVANSGIYAVTATDIYGCQGVDSIEVFVHPLPNPNISGPAQICPGANAVLLIDAPFATYQWTGGSQQSALTIDQGGNYQATVTDQNGCSNSASFFVGEFVVTPPEISGTSAICPGASTTLSGPPGQMSYTWFEGEATQVIAVDEPGAYELTVVDPNGCPSSNTFTVSEFVVTPPSIQAPAGFCTGDSAVILAENGFQDYNWSNGLAGNSITITDGGLIELTAADSNGCLTSQSVTVSEYPLPNVNIGGSTSFCTGGSTVLNAGGVYASYSWSTGLSTPSITVNQPGNYGLTVTDPFGCRNDDSVEITEDTELNPEISGNLFFCTGGQTVLSAGDGFSTYSWSTNETASSITVVNAGAYGITVSDAGGCMGSATVVVDMLPLPAPAIVGENAFCSGNSTLLAADRNYAQYQWSNGSSAQSVSIHQPGDYHLTVTDAAGCRGTASVSIAEHPLPEVSISGVPFFCAGGSTVLTATPGLIAYKWSSGSTLTGIEVATPGNYQVTATNTFGCEGSASFSVSQIPLPVSDAGTDKFITCSSPVVTLGGVESSTGAQYTYFWSGPDIGPATAGLYAPAVQAEGIYTLVVADTLHGCVSLPSEVRVSLNNTLPEVVIALPDTLTCAVTKVKLDGGGSSSGPFIQYQWMNGSNQPIPGADSPYLEVSQPQIYALQVSNQQTGCKNQKSTQVESNQAIPAAHAGPDRLIDCNNPTVTLDAGGVQQGPGYLLTWVHLNSGVQLNPADPVMPVVSQPGNYELTVIDLRNGCRSSDQVFVGRDAAVPEVNAGSDQVLDCNSSTAILNGSTNMPDHLEIVWTLEGHPMFAANALIIETNQPGRYTLTAINPVNGCQASDEVLVRLEAGAITALAIESHPPTCFGDQDAELVITGVTGGLGPYLFSINGSPYAATAVFRDLTGGQYRVSVQDASGCDLDTLVQLPEGNDLRLDLGPDQTIQLGEEALLHAQINIPESSVLWLTWTSNLDSLPCASCLDWRFFPRQTVTFGLALSDVNGCATEDEVTIYVNKKRQIFIPNAFSPNGDGDNDILFIQAGQNVARIRDFKIFDRWGGIVFQAGNFLPNDPAFGWDGRYSGQFLNAAVFVYFVEIEYIDGRTEKLKGDITMMR